MNIYILCGLPGSGKSTWAREKSSETGALIVNRDSIRTMFFGSYRFNKDVECIVHNCTEHIIRELLDGASADCTNTIRDIIIDECNLTIARRKFWTDFISANTLSENKINIIVVWFTENKRNSELREKNDLRGYTKEYWDNVISNMKISFQQPTENEDIDEVIEVQI